MLQPTVIRRTRARLLAAFVRRGAALLLWLSICGLTTYAQGNFVSGSTGADGPFNPTQSQTIQLPESGVFNFTTVTIPAGVIITFGRNARNTPVTILVQGNVNIAGMIDVSAFPGTTLSGGMGGPGGFNGGAGGPSTNVRIEFDFQKTPGVNGDGPGGGSGGGSAATPEVSGSGGGGGFAFPGLSGTNQPFITGVTHGAGGPKYGLPTLLPLIGGSGGGGQTGSSAQGTGGGGGGGAILIASSGTINFITDPATTTNIDQRIRANGGDGCVCPGGGSAPGSGGGSGGAVRLIANRITGRLNVKVNGGFPSGAFGGSTSGGYGGGGYVRIEAFDLNSLTVDLADTNPLSAPRVTTATPGVVTPPALPSIRIVSVAGVAPPNQPNGSLQGGADIVLPANQPNPVSVALSASNIKSGTTLQVTLTPENGARVIAQSTPLAGTLASSTASASIALPDGLSVIQASGTIDVLGSQLTASNGERVKQIEVSAVYGGNSTVTYITESGKRIKAGQ